MALNSTEEIIEDIRRGRMVVLMDDEDRENEGDLLMAAAHCRADDVNFMARYGRGLICLTLTAERCQQLRLPLMVSATDEKHATNFTVSIEAAEGVTTGISAADRARTVQAAVRADATAADLVTPGHIFPLMAQKGGVLTRAGHTEAGCDLARLAGLEPAAVIVEILSEDGTMARRPELERFAAEHGLKIGTVADLIRYRLETEKTVVRSAETRITTRHGDFRLLAYEDALDRAVHFALVRGTLDPEAPVLVRVHVENVLTDQLALDDADAGWPLEAALAYMGRQEQGVLVVLRKPEPPFALLQRVREIGLPARPPAHRPGISGVLRTHGIGAQILKDLGVRRMRVLSSTRRFQAISGFGLEVVDVVAPE